MKGSSWLLHCRWRAGQRLRRPKRFARYDTTSNAAKSPRREIAERVARGGEGRQRDVRFESVTPAEDRRRRSAPVSRSRGRRSTRRKFGGTGLGWRYPQRGVEGAHRSTACRSRQHFWFTVVVGLGENVAGPPPACRSAIAGAAVTQRHDRTILRRQLSGWGLRVARPTAVWPRRDPAEAAPPDAVDIAVLDSNAGHGRAWRAETDQAGSSIAPFPGDA